jgi:PPOX class probable F420-dependent enzyme
MARPRRGRDRHAQARGRALSPGPGGAALGERERYLSLATFRASGAEVATPVWFAPVEGTLYVFTAGDSGKVKRLRRSSRARIAPCDARGRVHGPWRDATARVITDPALIRRAEAALGQKYGLQKRLLDLGARLSGRIRRRAFIAIDASP